MQAVQVVRVSQLSYGVEDEDTRTELDSHAEACVVGKHALIFHDFDRPVNVTTYDPKGPTAKSMRTVSAALAYDDPETGETLILIVHQAISIPHMEHNLMSTFQLRLNDVIVNDVPKILTDTPKVDDHCLIVPPPSDEDYDPHLIPLGLHRVNSMFLSRKPSQAEFDSCRKFELTYESPDYDPSDPSFAQQEEEFCNNFRGEYQEPVAGVASLSVDPQVDQVAQVSSRACAQETYELQMNVAQVTLYDVSNTLDDKSFLEDMVSQVKVPHPRKIGVSGLGADVKKQGTVDAEKLSKNWSIGLDTAHRTLKVTTQRGVRTVLHPTLSRRFRTNDRQLRYRRLPVTLFTDTMYASVKSRRQNKCAQVFGSQEGWCRAYPMQKESEAHEALTLLHQREGVPNVMIMDNAQAQIKGKFRQKCRQVQTHCKQIEPHTPKSNAAENVINQLKTKVGLKMVKSKCPNRLWDDCLEREAYCRSCTALDIFGLGGQVPETIVSGETADISPFAIYDWYEWVKFRDSTVAFPDDKFVLGRDLGPVL